MVGIAGSLLFAVSSLLGQPTWLMLTALAMVLSAGVAAFAVVWGDARRNGTGWFRAARRAIKESLTWLWDLMW